MRRLLRYLLLLWSLLIGCASVYPTPVTMRGLSVSGGLSDMLVNAIYKDSLGYVWLGTGSSLDRFDGVHIRTYTFPGNEAKLKRVNAIAEMEGHELWVGNGMGLWRLNRRQTALEQIVPERIYNSVNALLPDGMGTLYIGTDAGLFIYREGRVEQLLPDENMLAASNSVLGLAMGQQNDLWLSTANGLYHLTLADRRWEVFHHVGADRRHRCAFHAITRIGPMLYLGTDDQGILTFDTRTHRFDTFVDVGCHIISALSGDGEGMLYVGTDGNGVHFVDVAARRVVRSMCHQSGSVSNTLRSNSVYSLLVDRDGLVWVGLYQLGLDYTLYQNHLFTVYAYPPYFDSHDLPVRALSIRGDERVVGSRDGLFYIDEKRQRFKEFQRPSMRSGMVFCIRYVDGEYYVGTYGGGMYIFDPERMTLRDFDTHEPQPFQYGHIFCMEQDADGLLWIGTSEGLYGYKDGVQKYHYTGSNSKLPDGNVYEIYFDSTHRGWVCTENGMGLLDPYTHEVRTDAFPEGFIHKEKIRVVYEDEAHHLYFFPDKGSMTISDLTLNSFRRQEAGTPLDGHNGLFLIGDTLNRLWVGTDNGLFLYDGVGGYVPYTFADGIPCPAFTLCPPMRDEQGNLWLGNSKGLLRLDAAYRSRQPQSPYPLQVTEVYVHGRPLDRLPVQAGTSHGVVSLDASQDNVTFRFSDFSYTSPAYTAYEYMLDGYDEEWQSVSGVSEAAYYDLAPGTYTFRVRKTGQPDTEAALSVEILSSWTGRWALVVAFLLLAGLLFGIRRLRSRRRMAALPLPAAPQPAEAPAEESEPTDKPAVAEKYRTVNLTADECRKLSARLDRIMQKEKPYIRPELKIADLAAMLGVSAHTLSYLFNQYLQRNYYDYINDYRIAEFKRLVAVSEQGRYTLSALAEQCGFSSRASFFRYFKKATGITPNEYIHSLQQKEG